jgi:outer membrane protein TolC
MIAPVRQVAFAAGEERLSGLAENATARGRLFRAVATAGVLLFCVTSALTSEGRRLTLEEAVRLALSQNRILKIARFKVKENEERKAGARSDYFPTLTNQSNALHISELQGVTVPAGALGTAAGGPIPSQGITLQQGKDTLYSSGTMIAQPLTQLLRIHQENRMAAAEVATSRDELKNSENEIALQVHTLYFGILVAQLQKQAAEQETSFAAETLRESENDVTHGSALRVAEIQSRADLLQGQQAVLTAELQIQDYMAELNDLLGLPLETKLELEPVTATDVETRTKAQYVKAAWEENPKIRSAEEAVAKARAGVAAAKTAYIPDVTVYARHSYQDGVPFFVRNFGTVGVSVNYTLWDFGKRHAAVREHEAQLDEAEENVERLKEEVAVAIERSYNKMERTRNMISVATQVAKLRGESERLATDQAAQGVVLISDVREATASSYKAKADLLQATLGYLLAWAELERTVGRAPGLETR